MIPCAGPHFISFLGHNCGKHCKHQQLTMTPTHAEIGNHGDFPSAATESSPRTDLSPDTLRGVAADRGVETPYYVTQAINSTWISNYDTHVHDKQGTSHCVLGSVVIVLPSRTELVDGSLRPAVASHGVKMLLMSLLDPVLPFLLNPPGTAITVSRCSHTYVPCE